MYTRILFVIKSDDDYIGVILFQKMEERRGNAMRFDKSDHYDDIRFIMSVLQKLLSHYRSNCGSEDLPVVFREIALWFEVPPDTWRYQKFYDRITSLEHVSIEHFSETLDFWKHSNDRYRTKVKLRRIQKWSLVFIRTLQDAIQLYDEKNFDQLEDLIDMIHGLPDALLHPKWNERSYIKIYLDSYKKHYGVSYADLLRPHF